MNKRRSLWRVEFGRLLNSPLTWLAVAAVAVSALSGNYVTSSSTMASRYLAWQIAAACRCATLAFALLTLWTLSRIQRSGVDALCDCVVSPRRLAAVRLLALLAASLAATVLLLLLYAPVAVEKLGIVFSIGDYLASFFFMLFPAMAFGCMVAALCYQITRRIEVSALLTVAFVMVSESGLCENQYLWQWRQPFFSALSDDFSNDMVFRMAGYNRLVWLCLLGGGWLLSLLCVRRYGKGLFGSLRNSLQKPWTAALAACFLLGGICLWNAEPFFDDSPVDWMNVPKEDRSIEGVFLAGTDATVTLKNTLLGRLEGKSILSLHNTTGQAQPFYFQLNCGYTVQRITANGREIGLEDLQNDYIGARELRCTLPPDEKITLEITYGGSPRAWNIAQNTFGNGTIISGRYVELVGKSLSPVCELEMEEGTPFVLRLTLPAHLTPVTSGDTPKQITQNADGTATWLARDVEENAMTLFAGDYVSIDLQGGETPITFYYSKKHQAQLEGANATETMQAAIAFCTAHFGPRSFKEGQAFKIVQGSELMFGGFARQNISTIWSFGYYLAVMLPFLSAAGLLLLTGFYTKSARQTVALVQASPMPPWRYALVRCAAVAVGQGLLSLCVVGMGVLFYLRLFGAVSMKEFGLLAALMLLPLPILSLGLGSVLGHGGTAMLFGLAVLLFLLPGLPAWLEPTGTTFFRTQPLTLGLLEPPLQIPIPFWLGRLGMLLVGLGLLFVGTRFTKSKDSARTS